MPNIYERVRRQQAKQDAARINAEEAPARRRMAARVAADTRAERRLAGLLDGTITPRNAREDEIQCGALDDMGIDY